MALDKRVALLMWLSKKTGRAFNPNVSVGAFRAGYLETNKKYGLKQPTGVDVTELTIPTSDGATIGARLYRRSDAAGKTLPVMVYFHGGGWVIGDVEGYDGLTRFMAYEGEFAVISVDYRLGPEHKFPRFFEDSFDAYAWVQKNAVSLGLDPAKIAVGGDSAGGGISAAICSYAESRGLASPSFAYLIYPSVDATGRFPSRSQYTSDLPLTPASIAWFSEKCANTEADRRDPLFVPLDAPNPERHPPAYILAAQYDPLVDEGRAYFEKLKNAGVPVTYDLRPTLPHALVNIAGIIPEAKKAFLAGVRATAAHFGTKAKRVVALTGAGSGIGRALAIELTKADYALALADRNEAGLLETAKLVSDRTNVTTHVLDVSDKAAVDAFAADVVAKHGRVDVVVNNAGVSIAGDVAELTVEEIKWLMDINFWGTVYGVKAFLPELQKSDDATIVNLSSVFGLFGPPGQSAYAASKFAVRGFSESLRGELRGKVHVVTVHPGGIATNIAKSSRIAAAANQELNMKRKATFEKKMLTQSPEKAARYIARGIAEKRDRVLIGVDALQIDVITRLLGARGSALLAKIALRGVPTAKTGAAKKTVAPTANGYAETKEEKTSKDTVGV
jgi:acetyl esterase/lipase/short-subunit dehydrogenase